MARSLFGSNLYCRKDLFGANLYNRKPPFGGKYYCDINSNILYR